MSIDQIREIRHFRRMDQRTHDAVIAELALATTREDPARVAMRPHIVQMGDRRLEAVDAKALNRYDRQGGRGCWRYLVDPKTKRPYALAWETDRGNYRIEMYFN